MNVIIKLICIIMLSAGENRDNVVGFKKSLLPLKELGCIACAALCACTLTMASPVIAANQVCHIYMVLSLLYVFFWCI